MEARLLCFGSCPEALRALGEELARPKARCRAPTMEPGRYGRDE